ncbi:hypothetical protein [Vibrio sp. SCSIO 43136]|uniref:hypothetical protein n=1 Tax=Vibrio sp. SCSIO 43136 TaxID=2819101 RepID=UPI0020759B15|nr:hypothetical protein [Vibrio sp. SCSIO 43136]USD64058.1 hypothetical protein J4N39_07945 [Vibrio sp. SCSIO 43136]
MMFPRAHQPSGKLVLVLFFVTNAVFSLMLIYSIPKLMSYASGLEIFDMSPTGYNYEMAVALLNGLGEEGRAFYYRHLMLDTLYPALFAVCYYLLFHWVANKSQLQSNGWLWLSALPLLSALFDYLENIGIYAMLQSYPDLSANLVEMTSWFTVVKSMSATLYWFALLTVAAVGLVKWLKKRRVATAGG